jgi:phenylacetate-CoA ligase
VYGADTLSDPVRRLILDEFKIPVLSGYQSVEAPRIGFECDQHLGLHLNIDIHPVRIVDAAGHTLPPGESGEVVVSNLVNRATVLLNYRLGDLAALLPDPCPCGRTLPLLSFPLGRSDDFLVLPSGEIVHPHNVCDLFRFERRLWQFQVVQETPTHFRVALVVAEGCDRRKLSERIAAGFAGIFGGEARVDVSFVDAIERTAAGKCRPLVSKCRRPGPATPEVTAARAGERSAPAPPDAGAGR